MSRKKGGQIADDSVVWSKANTHELLALLEAFVRKNRGTNMKAADFWKMVDQLLGPCSKRYSQQHIESKYFRMGDEYRVFASFLRW